jgi:arginyl-tRNA synthetase
VIDLRLAPVQKLQNLLSQKYAELNLETPPAMPETADFDFALPCFPLAKSMRKSPPAIAEEVAAFVRAEASELCQRVETLKGYVNIQLKPSVLSEALELRLDQPLKESATALAKQKFVVDFSSPNIAKPFGIGHLRSTNIGAALCRILGSLGAEVVRVNHLGDWGTQFGKMITAYKRFGSAEFVKGDPVNNLYKLYVEFHQREAEDPALIDEARDWFVRLEKGDEEALELWKWFRDVSYHEFKRIYDKLGVDFDYVTGESFYNNLMEKTVETLSKKGLLKESDGAMIVDLEPYDMPPCLIKKTDGSTLYATRDITTAEYRMKTFEPTHLVYVVGSEQALHFKQVFKVLTLLGYEWADRNCVHVNFGLIKFPEGKMSTRKGNIILLEDVLKQAEQRALEIIDEKEKDKPQERKLSDDEKQEVARQVGTGSVIFFDLHARRTKDVLFDWKTLLNFEGDSGPYLQYTTVRVQALLEKAGSEVQGGSAPLLSHVAERDLARSLLHFPAVVEAAAREYEPSIISHALLDLCGVFNRFYRDVPVLKAEPAERAGRITLVRQTLATLKTGLGLLGLECPQRM